MKAMGEKNQWRPGLRPGHADDYAVIATYAKIYQRDKDKAMLAPALALFNFLASRKYDEPLVWGGAIETRELAWCDALFMGPPAMAAVSVATGDRKYLDLANRLWWKTTEYLYDKDEKLYFRDSRYFEQREKNGKKVFWSRGNGWVIAGLARLLQDMPRRLPGPRAATWRSSRRWPTRCARCRARTATGGRACSIPRAGRTPRPAAPASSPTALAWGINNGAARSGDVRAERPQGLGGDGARRCTPTACSAGSSRSAPSPGRPPSTRPRCTASARCCSPAAKSRNSRSSRGP